MGVEINVSKNIVTAMWDLRILYPTSFGQPRRRRITPTRLGTVVKLEGTVYFASPNTTYMHTFLSKISIPNRRDAAVKCARVNSQQIHIQENESGWNLAYHEWLQVTSTSIKNCTRCGCTLWTIPMHLGGQKLIVRVALLDKG
jgi:hypothetical protein